MSRFITFLELAPDRNERSARLTWPLVYESDLIGTVPVPIGFETDFASIPRAFWSVLPPMGRYGEAAVVHDYLYRRTRIDRATCDAVLLEAMTVLGVPWLTRQTIYRAVRCFGGKAWSEDRNTMNRIKLSLAVLAALIVAGCAHVPTAKIKFNPKTGEVSVDSPKEVTLTNLAATIDGPKVTVTIGGLSSHNSPDVVAAVATANAATAKAWSDFGVQAISAGVTAAAKSVVPVAP